VINTEPIPLQKVVAVLPCEY